MLSAGSAVVADFGIARAVTAAGAGEHLTQTGTIIGTPAYMSPEQATGRADVDGRSDEYSLACVEYEMLVGEPPFTGPTAQAVIARHSLDLVSPPSIVRASIPDAVEAAILRALSKVPADRYTTTALFAEALNTPSPATGAVRRATLERGVARPRLGWRRVVPLVVAVAATGGYVVVRSLRPARVATGGPDPRRLAVLYFADDSKGHTLGYLADGLTEALIAELRQVPSLTVISRNGVAPYRDPDLPADSVARALKVGTIVRGGVAPAEGAGGRGYQVSVRLIDGASGADFKRASFEQPAGAVLAMRDSLAQKVAGFLRERLGEELRLREQQAGTKSVEAWSLLQQGERARKDGEVRLQEDDVDGAFGGFARADSLLAAAEATDPQWVEPVVQRGWIAHRRARLTADRKAAAQGLGVALAHAERALRLVPGYPRALELRGTARYTKWLLELSADPVEQVTLLTAARHDRFSECKLWLMTSDAVEPDVAEAWRLYAKLDTLTPAPSKPYEMHQAGMIVGAVLARSRLPDSARHVLVAARADARVDPKQDLLSVEAFARTLLGEQGEAIELLKRYVAANPAHSFERGGVAWLWLSCLLLDLLICLIEVDG